MNILILIGSPRQEGNTQLLAEAFARGAETHHHVTTLSVRDLNVGPCTGCNACFASEGNACFQNDDMARVYAQMAQADVLVIASPVYFYGISAQLKAVIDRLHNPLRNTFHIKKMALLLVGGASLPELFDSITAQYELALRFFNLEDGGRVLVRGVRECGDIRQTPALEEAYTLGERQ